MKILSFDVGGTRLKYGEYVYDGKLKEICVNEIDSKAKLGAQPLLEQIDDICDSFKFDMIAISTAGMVDKNGTISYANENIPNYTGVKLKKRYSEKYGVPVYVLNDIAAGAIAETDENRKNFYYISLGTGVGGIRVIDGTPDIGENGIAGQIGYLKSYKGDNVIDKTASASAIESISGKDAKSVFKDAENGDKKILGYISAWAKEVMYLIGLIVGFCDPKEIIIGGGISRNKKISEYFLKEKNILPEPYRNKFTITTARHSGMSGVIGAAKYAIGEYYGK